MSRTVSTMVIVVLRVAVLIQALSTEFSVTVNSFGNTSSSVSEWKLHRTYDQSLTSPSYVRSGASPSHVTVSTSHGQYSDTRFTTNLDNVSSTDTSITDEDMSFQNNYSSVDFLSEYFSKCQNESSVNEFNVGFVQIRFENSDKYFAVERPCSLMLAVPRSLVVRIQTMIIGNVSVNHLNLQIYDVGKNHDPLWTSYSPNESAFSFSNKVQVVLYRWTASPTPFTLYLNVSAVPPPPRPQLEINYTTATQGM